jgi:hypothetical protein
MGHAADIEVRLDLRAGHAACKPHRDNLMARERQHRCHVDPFAASSLVDRLNPVAVLRPQVIDLVRDV